MRVNIYAQEITDRLELVTATAENTGAKFVGIRFYLDSPESLKPPIHPDDDSSAVTFWVKSGKSGYKPGDSTSLAGLLRQAAMILDEGPPSLIQDRAEEHFAETGKWPGETK